MDVGHEVIVVSDDDSATVHKTEAARQRAAHEADVARCAAKKKHAAKNKLASKELADERKVAARDHVAAREANVVAIRGPRRKGKAKFDEYCVFANRVALDHSQVKRLKEVAKEKPKRCVYVCTIKGAHIDRQRAKMYFTWKYSNSYIKKYLDLPAAIDIYLKKKYIDEVRVIFGKGKETGVQITSNWKKVVRKTKMREGQVFMFWFRGCKDNDLKMIVEKVK